MIVAFLVYVTFSLPRIHNPSLEATLWHSCLEAKKPPRHQNSSMSVGLLAQQQLLAPGLERCVLHARHAPRRSRDALMEHRRRPCLLASAFRVCPLKLLGRELPPAAQTLLPNSLKPLPSSAGTTSVDFGGRDRGGGGGVRQRRRCDPSVCPSSVRLSVPPFAHPSVRLTT